MPYFRVVLHGQGIRFALGEEEPVVGFYATRLVRAGSAEEAVHKAKQAVQSVWARPEYAQHNLGNAPVLSTDLVEPISFLQSLRGSGGGHAFYTQ